ncbi:hypothetical protein J2S30_003355 [Herbaspirillum rubrisubalbicans]|uniref:hypothetical protein n=1 Tax=Herbaspirillum rubrisubalbicans TaxID=80842 RepID=UPI0020A06396|nr:hypothetical protein [Herbaspirillum rubrisubalbicans]MCP1574976.1 hypothetical protein [Herbaspirillum rubrisubalbicans]
MQAVQDGLFGEQATFGLLQRQPEEVQEAARTVLPPGGLLQMGDRLLGVQPELLLRARVDQGRSVRRKLETPPA